MATEWYLMGSMPVYNSGYEKEEFDMFAKDSFTEILETSPVSRTIQIINHDLTLISEIKSVILNNVADSTVKSKERQLLVAIGALQCGDYIKYENTTWLVTSFVGNNGIYEKSIAELCNWTLKFQSQDGTILSYPCITSNKSFNQDENKVITLGSNEKSILLPYDENTALLTTDRRMYVDKRVNPTPYKVIGDVDTTSYNYGNKGLIYFVMKQDELGSPDIDRVDLGICDYFEPTTTLPPIEGYSYSEIICSNPNNEITLGGSARTLTPTFYNADNTIAENITAVWTWVKPLGHDRDFTITHDGNLAKIKVAENYDLIGMKVTANVMSLNGGYGGEITLMITL